jgi:pilus assembly protein CpaE
MTKLAFGVFSTDGKVRAAIADALEATGRAHVVARIAEPARLGEALGGTALDGVYVDLGSDPGPALDLIEAAPATRPLILVGGPADDARSILRAMRLGVREFFPNNETGGELQEVLERIQPAPAPLAAPSGRGRVIAIAGSKGGVGSTFVACQLAAAVHELGRSAVVVDLDLPFGDVALQLDLRPRHTLADVVRDEGEVDATFVRTLAEPHASGVCAIAAPPGPEESEAVRPHHVEKTLGLLRGEFDVVIADLGRDWTAVALGALDAADELILVTSLDVPALTHARDVLRLLPRLGTPAERTHVLLNRTGRHQPLKPREIEEFLGRPHELQVPSDWNAASEAINQGRALARVAPGTRIHDAFGELARKVLGWCGLDPAGAPAAPETMAERLRSGMRRMFVGSR